jgi:DNA-directed RNA polymerase specialized sigma24 family protein
VRAGSPALDRFSDGEELVAYLLDQRNDADARRDVLAALVEAAQCECVSSAFAATLVWLALWPGLDAINRRQARREPRESADVVAGEVEWAFTMQLARLDLTRTRCIAASLLRSTEREVVVALRRARLGPDDRDDTRVDPDATIAHCEHRSVAMLRPWLDELAPRDADLVMRTVVLGETQHEAGAAHGLSPDAVRKHVARALDALRRWDAAETDAGRRDDFVSAFRHTKRL